MRQAREPLPELVLRLRAAGCVFAEEEAALLMAETADPDIREAMVARRLAGEPLEHVLGWVDFCGQRIAVDADVFVPRQRTAFLVQRAVALAAELRRPVVVDLCCGTGAIGAAIAARLTELELVAADLDPAAVTNARRNLAPWQARVVQGELYDALPEDLRMRVDVLVVNAPYVPTLQIATMPAEARDHEPALALDGGADGLDVHRRVVAGARTWLAPGGSVLIETSTAQAVTALGLMKAAGLTARQETSPELCATVVIGRLT